MIGAFCGIKGAIFSLIVGSLLGTIVGVPAMLIRGVMGQDMPYHLGLLSLPQ